MRISIITPSFNQGRFIERTLRSVSEQGIEGLEHLVMDGGSKDETVAVLRDFRPSVKWVSEPDRGQTDALNKGILASQGEIIGWLNSDDVYYPGALRRVLEVFDEHPEIDVVYGMADHIDIDDYAFEEYPTEPWDMARLQDTCFICQPALFLRRRVIDTQGLPDERLQYCMDYEYWVRLGLGGAEFLYIPHKLAGSRLYSENKTLGARIAVHREINAMLKGILGKVPDRWLFNYAHAVVEPRIDRGAHPRRFLLSVMWHACIASLRWNRGISRNMRDLIRDWNRHAYRI